MAAKRKLKTIAEAVGHPNPNRINDTEELHGHPCIITVDVREYEGQDSNEIKNYKPASPAGPAAAPPKSTPPPAAAAPPPPPRPNQAAATPFDKPAEGGEALA